MFSNQTLQWLSNVGLYGGTVLAILSAVIALSGSWASGELSERLRVKNEAIQRSADERQREAEERIAGLNTQAEIARRDIANAEAGTARANQAAEDARARAAESVERAAQLSIDLQRTQTIIASRDLTPHQAALFEKELKGHALKIGLCFQPADQEALVFATRIYWVLHNAKQTVELLGNCPGSGVTVSAGATGIALLVRDKNLQEQRRDPLYRALVRGKIWQGYWQFPVDAPTNLSHLLIIPSLSPPPRGAFEAGHDLPQPSLEDD